MKTEISTTKKSEIGTYEKSEINKGKKTETATKYVEDITTFVSKKNGNVCGDHFLIRRTAEHTTFVLCDGMGSGIKANVVATMYASHLMHLLDAGFSVFEACENIVASMHRARTEDSPFAAFAVARILNDGQYTVLSFEMPPPIIIERRSAMIDYQRFFQMGHEVVAEAAGTLKIGDSLVLVSDGITQAGLGVSSNFGWSAEGFVDFLDSKLGSIKNIEDIVPLVYSEAYKLSGDEYGDDTTMAILRVRNARQMNLLTGPPSAKHYDEDFVRNFEKLQGYKAICGSSTADMVARVTGRTVKVEKLSPSFAQPPKYQIDGFELVTEGVITLNQAYNILEEEDTDLEFIDEDSSVQVLCKEMLEADIIRIYMGGAQNSANDSIQFKQLGLMSRAKVIKHIISRLQDIGKIVTLYSPE